MNLPFTIKESLNWYTQEYYENVNNYLRYGNAGDVDIDKLKQVIKNIDRAFESVPPLQTEMVVYRGQRDDTFNTKSYTSTTVEPRRTQDFLNFATECCMYRITVNPGSKILPLRNVSSMGYENEILLDRNGIMGGVTISKDLYSFDGNEVEFKTFKLAYLPGTVHVIREDDDLRIFENMTIQQSLNQIIRVVQENIEFHNEVDDNPIDIQNADDENLKEAVYQGYNQVKSLDPRLPPYDDEIYVLIVDQLRNT